MLRKGRDPHAGGHRQVRSTRYLHVLHRRPASLGGAHRLLQVRAGQEHDELLAAKPPHDVVRAQRRLNGVGRLLPPDGKLILYGAFNYGGAFTTESNARFDRWLKERDPLSGIRDFEAVNALAERAGMLLEEDYAMPNNNRILYWRKEGPRAKG